MPAKYSKNDVQQAYDFLLALGELTVRFATVERAPRYPSGNRENDLEHSYHLAISATELAANYYPELDVGLVSQFSFVHDLPESYVGDTWTLAISDKDRLKKESTEAKATKRLIKELPPFTADLLKRYEQQIEPEARFVRLVDKLMPTVINMLTGEASTFQQDHGITNLEDLMIGHELSAERLHKMFPEFGFIHLVRELISDTSAKHIFSKK